MGLPSSSGSERQRRERSGLLHRQHAERAVVPLLHDVSVVLPRKRVLLDLLDGVGTALGDLLVGHPLGIARPGDLCFVPCERDQVVQSIPVGAGFLEIRGSGCRESGNVSALGGCNSWLPAPRSHLLSHWGAVVVRASPRRTEKKYPREAHRRARSV